MPRAYCRSCEALMKEPPLGIRPSIVCHLALLDTLQLSCHGFSATMDLSIVAYLSNRCLFNPELRSGSWTISTSRRQTAQRDCDVQVTILNLPGSRSARFMPPATVD